MSRNQSDNDSEAAYAALYHKHFNAVMGYALRRCDADDAADIAAETFVVAWRRFDAVPEEPEVKPWLLGVARRILANQHRGIRRRGELVRKVSTYMAPRFHDMAEIEGYGEPETIVAALNRLSAKDREVLMLVAWEELAPAEIGVALGISGSAVRKRLLGARKRLADTADRIDEEWASDSRPVSGHDQFVQLGEGVAAR